jgi:Membrane-bound serine protease (ClpP class)
VGILAGVFGDASPGGATGTRRTIDVIQVDGLIDPPNAALIREAIKAANRDGSRLLVIKFNSGGAVDVDPTPLVNAARDSRVPIVAWVGPSGSKARGLAALLVTQVSVAAVSNGSSIGPVSPLLLDDPNRGDVKRLAIVSRRWVPALLRSLNSDDAVRLGVTDRVCASPPGCATLGDFVVALDGTTVHTAAGDVKLHTAKVVGTGKNRRRQPLEQIRFRKLDLIGQAVHTLTSPTIAYGLLVVGLALIVFEFFTISIGLAGGTGAVALVGAFVGFSHLPVTIWALAMILFAMFGYAIDVQAGRAYSWTVISTVLLIVGSLFLFGGSSSLDVYWWAIVLMVISTVAFFVTAMPVAVRSRFSTPTIGRESLVGELGEAAVDIAPDGVVLLRGARWRARTNRATPITAGQPIRVIEVDGLVLEVEPEDGGARDYREPKAKA